MLDRTAGGEHLEQAVQGAALVITGEEPLTRKRQAVKRRWALFPGGEAV
ncbi:hypothetical protein ACLK1U_02855 [Escherichia coli]